MCLPGVFTYLVYALIRAELVNKLCRLSQVSICSLCSIVLLSYVQDRTLSIHDLHALCIKVSQTTSFPSTETKGQLVGTTGFSWAKVYNKSGRAPGHLLLPTEFQKRLKSRLLIGQKNFFLANQRRGTARRLSCLLTRGCFPHQLL